MLLLSVCPRKINIFWNFHCLRYTCNPLTSVKFYSYLRDTCFLTIDSHRSHRWSFLPYASVSHELTLQRLICTFHDQLDLTFQEHNTIPQGWNLHVFLLPDVQQKACSFDFGYESNNRHCSYQPSRLIWFVQFQELCTLIWLIVKQRLLSSVPNGEYWVL